MARQANQKLKLLYLLEILRRLEATRLVCGGYLLLVVGLGDSGPLLRRGFLPLHHFAALRATAETFLRLARRMLEPFLATVAAGFVRVARRFTSRPAFRC